MSDQQKQLDSKDPLELMRATVKYDELMQTIYQNKILVEKGYWPTLLCNSDNIAFRLYTVRRNNLISGGIINEDELRKAVINQLHK